MNAIVKMNEIVNKFLLAVDKCKRYMFLKQPGTLKLTVLMDHLLKASIWLMIWLMEILRSYQEEQVLIKS